MNLSSNTNIIYYICDHPKLDSCYVIEHQKSHNKTIKQADIVTVSSSALFKSLQKKRPSTLIIPNGVNVDDFRICASGSGKSIKTLGKKLIT